MRYTLLALLLFIFCFGCKNTQENTSKDEPSLIEKDSLTTENEEAGIDPWETRDKVVDIPLLKTYLKKAQQMRESLLAQLKSVTPDQADQIYLSGNYQFSKIPEFAKVDSISMPAIMRSSGVSGCYQPTDEDKEVLKLLTEQGLEPQYIGEGYSQLSTNPMYYYHIFEPYVTPETKEFIKIWADQDDVIEMDAGLVVPLSELYTRCVTWEKYLEKYPQSKHKKAIVSQYGMYMSCILFYTSDNTRTFNYETNKIDDTTLEEIQKLIVDHPEKMQISIIVKTYLDELEKQNFRYSKELENKIMSLWILKDYDKSGTY